MFLSLCSCARTPVTRISLTIVLTSDIRSISPNERFEAVSDSVFFNVFEPLVGLDKDLKLEPVLAESWENPRPEEWRFHLKRGIYFHDGTLMTARNVRDAILQIRNTPEWEISDFLNAVQDVQEIDDHTIAIITRTPYAILYKLPFVYVTKKNSSKGFPPEVGTGPYQMTSWIKGKSITLEKWDHYWGEPPAIAEVNFVPIADAGKRYQHLLDGKADIIYSVPFDVLSNNPAGIRFLRRPGITVYYLGFNVRNQPGNPFADLRVRQALHMAISRKQLVQTALHGYGAIPTQPVAPFVFGFDPSLPEPEYNPQKAQKLLAQAGYKNGFSTRLDFTDSRMTEAALIQKDLQNIHVTVRLNPVPSVYDLTDARKSEFFLAGWDCSSGDASEFLEFCLHTPGEDYGDGNYGYYSNNRIDEISETHAVTTDDRMRREILQEASRIAMEELPVLPVFIQDDIYAMKENISFEPRADSEIKLIDVKVARTQ